MTATVTSSVHILRGLSHGPATITVLQIFSHLIESGYETAEALAGTYLAL